MNCGANLLCLLELNHWGKFSSPSRNKNVKFLSIPTYTMKELAINGEICWWWLMVIQLILMGSIWQLTPLRAVVSDSLQNLQTLADPFTEGVAADSSFGLRCSFTEIWLCGEPLQGVKPGENSIFCCVSFLLTEFLESDWHQCSQKEGSRRKTTGRRGKQNCFFNRS